MLVKSDENVDELKSTKALDFSGALVVPLKGSS